MASNSVTFSLVFLTLFVVTAVAYSGIYENIVVGIPIDNGVEGDPEIECGATGITVNFNIRNPFQGHVYVKGRFGEAGCRSDEGGRKVAGIVLPFAACGTERSRSLNPRGVFVRQTIVITFHPQFLTKVDRAYTIQCFYMEADKTVSQELEVSEITTQFQSQTVPMPVCRYDILDGSPTGQPVKFATIGQMVFHKWTCDTETTDIFCMLVHSCVVDDGSGNRANLLTETGCALDKFLLQNLEYSTDLMAGREAHVFKFADKPALFFSCQISITIKEPGAQCPRPQCGEPGAAGAGAGATATGGAGAVAPAKQVAVAPAKQSVAPIARVTAPPPAKVTAPPAVATLAPPALVTAQPAAPIPTTAPPPSAKPALAVIAANFVSLAPAVLVENKSLVNLATEEHTTLGLTPTQLPLAPVTSDAASTAPPTIEIASTAGSPSIAPTTVPTTLSTETAAVQNDTAIEDEYVEIADEEKETRRKRLKRQPYRQSLDLLGVWDVKAQPILALDVDDDSASLGAIATTSSFDQPAPEINYCLSPVLFSFIVAFTVVFGLLSGTLCTVLCLRRSSEKSLL